MESLAQATVSYRKMAESAYRAYTYKRGDVPDWDKLSKQERDAWEAAVRQVDLCIFITRPIVDPGSLDERQWATWESPFEQ